MKTKKEYDKLKKILKDDFTWPDEYMFKFIVPSLPRSIEEMKALFL